MTSKDSFSDRDIGGFILDFRETGYGGACWINLLQDGENWQALVKRLINSREGNCK
jgi:hypothetical protein